MGESAMTRDVCAALRCCNTMVLPVVAGRMMPAGWPDRYVAHRAWSGWIEFKADAGRLSDIQLHVIEGLRTRGVNVVVARFVGGRIHVSDETGTLITVLDTPRTGTEAYEFLRNLPHNCLATDQSTAPKYPQGTTPS